MSRVVPLSAKMPSICIVIPYFGRWPDWMNFYLDGCARNLEFNFLFVTDCGKRPAPPNVRFIECGIEDVRERVHKKLGIRVQMATGYKLCDLRPAYGLIFDDVLKGYEFWGFGDIDCIYGKLSDFASAEVLRRVDIFSCRKEYVSGVLCLLRNIPLMNTLFKNSPDWENVFTLERHVGFDEIWGHADLILGKSTWDEKRELCYFTQVVFEGIRRDEIRGYFETVALEDIHSVVIINGRGVFENWMSYALVHFVVCKGRWYFNTPHWLETPRQYSLTRLGVFSRQKPSLWNQLLNYEYLKAFRKLREAIARKLSRILSRS